MASVIDLEDDSGSSQTSNKRSDAYQYFKFKSSRWHCNYCSANYSDASTTNLWRHITKKHPKAIETYEQPEKTGEMDKYEDLKRKATGTGGAKAEAAPAPEKVDDDGY